MTGEAASPQRIARHIRTEGPIALAAYMAMALHDPRDGYYARGDPFGATGDFITAPGDEPDLRRADRAVVRRSVGPARAARSGDPGRARPGAAALAGSTCCAPLPRCRDFAAPCGSIWSRRAPSCAPSSNAASAASGLYGSTGRRICRSGPLLLVANEFLDALPIRQLVRGPEHWRERLVGIDPQDRLVLVDGPETAAATLLVPEPVRGRAAPGTVVEICPAAARLWRLPWRRGSRVIAGAALFIDYGYGGEVPGPTLQAVRQHRPVSILERAGELPI